jgi:hypothetical protein
MGEAVVAPAKTAVLPVWTCGLGRTLLAVEVRNAYWRQFHGMRVQAFSHATVFPRDSTAKLFTSGPQLVRRATSVCVFAGDGTPPGAGRPATAGAVAAEEALG